MHEQIPQIDHPFMEPQEGSYVFPMLLFDTVLTQRPYTTIMSLERLVLQLFSLKVTYLQSIKIAEHILKTTGKKKTKTKKH